MAQECPMPDAQPPATPDGCPVKQQSKPVEAIPPKRIIKKEITFNQFDDPLA